MKGEGSIRWGIWRTGGRKTLWRNFVQGLSVLSIRCKWIIFIEVLEIEINWKFIKYKKFVERGIIAASIRISQI